MRGVLLSSFGSPTPILDATWCLMPGTPPGSDGADDIWLALLVAGALTLHSPSGDEHLLPVPRECRRLLPSCLGLVIDMVRGAGIPGCRQRVGCASTCPDWTASRTARLRVQTPPHMPVSFSVSNPPKPQPTPALLRPRRQGPSNGVHIVHAPLAPARSLDIPGPGQPQAIWASVAQPWVVTQTEVGGSTRATCNARAIDSGNSPAAAPLASRNWTDCSAEAR